MYACSYSVSETQLISHVFCQKMNSPANSVHIGALIDYQKVCAWQCPARASFFRKGQ